MFYFILLNVRFSVCYQMYVKRVGFTVSHHVYVKRVGFERNPYTCLGVFFQSDFRASYPKFIRSGPPGQKFQNKGFLFGIKVIPGVGK